MTGEFAADPSLQGRVLAELVDNHAAEDPGEAVVVLAGLQLGTGGQRFEPGIDLSLPGDQIVEEGGWLSGFGHWQPVVLIRQP